jgi:hypothetical protein
VLRMHTFKRFVHHSLSRACVDVQPLTSLAAEETPEPKSASRNSIAQQPDRRRSSVEAEAARRLRRSFPRSRQPLASAAVAGWSRHGTALRLCSKPCG